MGLFQVWNLCPALNVHKNQTEGASHAEGFYKRVSLLFAFYFYIGAFLRTGCICSGTSAFQNHLHVLNLLSCDSEGLVQGRSVRGS